MVLEQITQLNLPLQTFVMNYSLNNFGNKVITCTLFLGLSMTFECCIHEILLHKLFRYCIRCVSHKLLSNYLRNRLQYSILRLRLLNLCIKKYLVESLKVSLFVIYINDHSSFLFLYYLVCWWYKPSYVKSCFYILQTMISLELCKTDHWLKANKLSLDCNKGDFTLLNSLRFLKHNPTSFQVAINNHRVSPKIT